MKICSILLINKGMQNKTIIRNYYTSTRLAEMRRIYNTNYWREGGATGPLTHCWWEYAMV